MVNTTAVNMGITLHTLQKTATQLRIRLKPRITPQRPTNAVFPTELRKDINLLAKTSSKKKILEMYDCVIKRMLRRWITRKISSA
jgi:hypothetical protein